MPTESEILNALRTVKYPGYSRDIVSFGLVKNVSSVQGEIRVQVELNAASGEVTRQIQTDIERAARDLPGAKSVTVEIRPAARTPGAPTQAASAGPESNRIPGIKRIVAIASGKGGVGKSTLSVNLACALHHLGLRVGLLDCDIYGPSVPLMMGIRQQPTLNESEMIVPPSNHGVKLMSMGFLVEGDSPVIWRGPMIMKTIHQFFHSVAWGDLDYLLVDLPPGTGDAQLSLCQTVPLTGGVIVTTPQEASLGVVRKGIGMFQKLNVPILGIIENMSYFETSSGERVEIFGHGGGKNEANRQKLNFLGEIPIYVAIREGGDRGLPVVVSGPTTPPGQRMIEIAAKLVKDMG